MHFLNLRNKGQPTIENWVESQGLPTFPRFVSNGTGPRLVPRVVPRPLSLANRAVIGFLRSHQLRALRAPTLVVHSEPPH